MRAPPGPCPSLIGTVPFALAYAAGFVLLWPRARPVLRHFAPVGRMALTNYLAHSLVGAALFYAIGFGLVGRLQLLEIYAVALLIFTAQVLLSQWWLSRYEQRPAEKLWRGAAYRRGAQNVSVCNGSKADSPPTMSAGGGKGSFAGSVQ
jgi:uncharacterized membrane protein YeiB